MLRVLQVLKDPRVFKAMMGLPDQLDQLDRLVLPELLVLQALLLVQPALQAQVMME